VKRESIKSIESWLESAKELSFYPSFQSKLSCIDQLLVEATDWIQSVEKLQHEQKTPLGKIEALIISGEALPFDVTKGKIILYILNLI
jgi:phage tail tape-measure protein